MKKQGDTAIETSIVQLNSQIKQVKKSINKCEVSNKLYNRLLIDRATKRKELNSKDSNGFISFFKNNFKFKSEKKLISDYFK